MSRTCSGFTLIEIMAVVVIIGLLAALGIPNLVRARTETRKTLCISNLRVVDGAKELWALISRSAQREPVDEDEMDVLVKKGMPSCPAGGKYTYGAVGMTPTCSLAKLEGHCLPWACEEEQKQGQIGKEKDDGKKGDGNKGIRKRRKEKGISSSVLLQPSPGGSVSVLLRDVQGAGKDAPRAPSIPTRACNPSL